MAEADQFAQVVDEIAERVRRRLQAIQAGHYQPCTAKEAPEAVEPTGAYEPDCAPTCGASPSIGRCATVQGVRPGASRISPDSVRNSSVMAPHIEHTLP